MWILQISDIHVDNRVEEIISHSQLIRLMRESIFDLIHDEEPIIVAFCGDTIFQGNSDDYPSAERFLNSMKEEFRIDLDFCPCPGNHDICSGGKDSFEGFNLFSWNLTRDDSIYFSLEKTVAIKKILNMDFILINSAYHLDYAYGQIDNEQLQQTLEDSSGEIKFIILHHNLIPFESEDKSTVGNAYDMLKLAISKRVVGIFHGHCHRQSILRIGRLGNHSCSLIGVGSLLYPPSPNLNNQFNLIEIKNNKIKSAFRFRLIGDAGHGATPMRFNRQKMNFF